MSTQPDIQQEKSKANGKWATMKDAVHETEKDVADKSKEVATKGQEIIERAQEQAAELLESGGKFAKSASDKALKFAKAYPIQMAVGGIAFGLFLGSRLFGRRH